MANFVVLMLELGDREEPEERCISLPPQMSQPEVTSHHEPPLEEAFTRP